MPSASQLDKKISILPTLDPPDRISYATNILDGLLTTDNARSKLLTLATFLRIAGIDPDLSSIYTRNRKEITDRLQGSGFGNIRKSVKECSTPESQWILLSSIAPKAIADLNDACDAYSGIDTIPRLQSAVLRALNSNDNIKLVVAPFLKKDSFERLRNCLKAVLIYSQADVLTAHDACKTAIDTATAARNDFENTATRFGNRIAQLLMTVIDDANAHFADGPFSKPAEVELCERNRLYPLHDSNLDILVPFNLRNTGPGMAAEVCINLAESDRLVVPVSSVRVPTLYPDSEMVVYVPVKTNENPTKDNESMCVFRLSWLNPNGEEMSTEEYVTLKSQSLDINWETLRYSSPYSLEAVMAEDDLVGRTDSLSRVVRAVNTRGIGSVYIFGQKRVGKTSLAHVAAAKLDAMGIHCFYLDIGTINNADATTAVDCLTEDLSEAIFRRLPNLRRDVATNGSLSPLIRLLKAAVADFGLRIVIVLDEFDQLPSELLEMGERASSFFENLRAMRAIEGIGLVLVGGEKMGLISTSGPGEKLSKFNPVSVGYIDRLRQWKDFLDLVRQPTFDVLQFSDEACECVYRYTEGNPYFTKLICGQVLSDVVNSHDAFVDEREVESGVNDLLNESMTDRFSHYWDDYLLESDPQKRYTITLRRRLSLLAVGLTVRSSEDSVAWDAIVDRASDVGLNPEEVDSEIRGFVDRDILIATDGKVKARVGLFGRWIREGGQKQIVGQGEIAMNRDASGPARMNPNIAAAARTIIENADLCITHSDAQGLVDQWAGEGARGKGVCMYKERSVTARRVIEYLEQFGDRRAQYLVFRLLRGVRFVTGVDEAGYLQGAYNYVRGEMTSLYESWNKGNIRISYTGSEGKSGLELARRFADENGFMKSASGILAPHLLRRYGTQHDVKHVVLVDDFVGTGDQLCCDLKSLADLVGIEQRVHLFVLGGMKEGLERVKSQCSDSFGTRASVRCMAGNDSSENPFGTERRLFGSLSEAEEARVIVEEFGGQLEPKAAMGYGECCALMVFQRAIPNNAPSILWSRGKVVRRDGTELDFVPLFPRN